MNTSFILHCTKCPRHPEKKLHKVEGAFGMPMSQPVETACKILNSKNQASEKQEQRTKQQQTSLLAAARSSGGPTKTEQGKVPGNKDLARKDHTEVGPRQCAYCKQEGHRERECPNLNHRQDGRQQRALQMLQLSESDRAQGSIQPRWLLHHHPHKIPVTLTVKKKLTF